MKTRSALPLPPRLLEKVRDRARYLRYSLHTEKAFVYWIEMFVRWSGMRLMEAIRLRVKDVDFERNVIVVRKAKGNKDRLVMLPKTFAGPLRAQMAGGRRISEQESASGNERCRSAPCAPIQVPENPTDVGWFGVFPSPALATDPLSGSIRRHHLYEERLARALKTAAEKAQIHRRVSAHTLRHSFETHLLQAGTDIRTVRSCLATAT